MIKSQSIVIIGASHAAAEAVSVLRRNGWVGAIHLIGDEDSIPYQRPPLSKAFLSKEIEAEKLPIKNRSLYEKLDITLHLNVRAEKIDRNTKTIICSNGLILNYSKLILATGARVRKLSIQGSDISRLHYLRSKMDVEGIITQLDQAKHILIIGAGYIGLEVAASMIKLGKKVTILEAMDRVLQRVTCPEISEFYSNVHRQHGVDIKLQSRLDHIEKDEDSYNAILANRDKIPFDLAVVGIGVIPNSELAEEAGLSCENGILVNQFSQTDDPDIYAVGDCSNHPSLLYNRRVRLESVPNAVAQAKTAAMHCCGLVKPYNEVPWFWSNQYDLTLQTAGLLQGYDTTVVRGDKNYNSFAVFYLKEDRVIAVDAINHPRAYMMTRKSIPNDLIVDPSKLADESIPLKDIFTI